jgi:hypothetical protein
MAYLLFPLDVSSTTARLWVGALNADGTEELSLEIDSTIHPLSPDWKSWVSHTGTASSRHQIATISALEPGTFHRVELSRGGEILAGASFRSPPPALPIVSEQPFTVLLASCFYENNDQEGLAGRAFRAIFGNQGPNLKILCGDQVYLDAPWWHYLLRHYSAEELEERFFASYRLTWMQQTTVGGFHEILRSGANYLTADDHEFWNNAPNAATYVLKTWTRGGRREWYDVARGFYERFQPTGPIAEFSAGTLSFFIADTRVDRRSDLRDFMKTENLAKLKSWVDQLSGPGVLIMGQPVFHQPAGWTGFFKDWRLPNYEQYKPLVRALFGSRHSLVFLTGDVHFGRVARCTLTSGADLIEVISSPLGLVHGFAGGSWESAPELFPAVAVTGVPKRPVETEKSLQLTKDHFLTLEFYQSGARVHMTVKAWPIPEDGSNPQGNVVYQRWLH